MIAFFHQLALSPPLPDHAVFSKHKTQSRNIVNERTSQIKHHNRTPNVGATGPAAWTRRSTTRRRRRPRSPSASFDSIRFDGGEDVDGGMSTMVDVRLLVDEGVCRREWAVAKVTQIAISRRRSHLESLQEEFERHERLLAHRCAHSTASKALIQINKQTNKRHKSITLQNESARSMFLFFVFLLSLTTLRIDAERRRGGDLETFFFTKCFRQLTANATHQSRGDVVCRIIPSIDKLKENKYII
jgi:hypothetical protein